MIIEITCPRCGCKFTGLGFTKEKELYCCEQCAEGGECECEGCAIDEALEQPATVVEVPVI